MRRDIEELVRTAFAWDDEEVQEMVLKYLSPCIAGKITKGVKVEVGRSKLGGMPDLPVSMDYPAHGGQYCEFLGQLNFQELKILDERNLLPSQGLLSIYCQFYLDKNKGEALEMRLQNASQFFGLYLDDLTDLERKAVPPALQATVLTEYAFEFGPYYNTIHSFDPRLGEVELEMGMEFELEDAIDTYFGYQTRPDCILLGNIIDNGENVIHQWDRFQQGLKKPIEYVSLLQMELPEELLIKRTKYSCSGHLNIGLPSQQLKEVDFTYLAFAYRTS